MHFQTAAAAALVFTGAAIAAPAHQDSYAIKISASGVQNDAQVAKYVGESGLYAVYKQGTGSNAAENLAFTHDAHAAQKFTTEVNGSNTVLKSSRGYLGTTVAPQGYGSVRFQSAVAPNVHLLFSPGLSNNRHLTDSENLFNQWILCYSPAGNNLYWTKTGFNLAQFNLDLPDQGRGAYHCAYVNVDVIPESQCH